MRNKKFLIWFIETDISNSQNYKQTIFLTETTIVLYTSLSLNNEAAAIILPRFTKKFHEINSR